MENMTVAELTVLVAFWTRQQPDSRNSSRDIRNNLAAAQFALRQAQIATLPQRMVYVNEGRAMGRGR